jgi:ribosome-associated toxin RatA of RatAB toxin-antitoxin module
MTKPIKNVMFKALAGSWRYQTLNNGQTRFSMTFEYDLKLKFTDKWLVAPILRRGFKQSLANLNRKFQPKQ